MYQDGIVTSLTLGQLQLVCIILKAIKQSFSAVLVPSGLPQFGSGTSKLALVGFFFFFLFPEFLVFKRTAVHGSLPGWSHCCVGSVFWCWVASLQVRDMFVFVVLSYCARLLFRQDTCFFNYYVVYYVVYLSFRESFFLSFEQVTLSLVSTGGSFLHVTQHGFRCEALSFFSY